MNLRQFLLLFLFMAFFSQANQACLSLSQLHWMSGSWETIPIEQNAAITKEQWVKVSEDTLEGAGQLFDVRGNIQHQEALRLVSLSEEIFFIAKTPGNSLPISFKATKCTTHSAWFENESHDFPQQIIYRKTPNGMNVRVQNKQGKGFNLAFVPSAPVN